MKYNCLKDDICTIKTLDRKCCQACRFRRCLEAGLNPKLLHSDRSYDFTSPKESVDKEKVQTLQVEVESPSALVKVNNPSTSSSLLLLNRMINIPFYGPLGLRSGLVIPKLGDDLSILFDYFNKVDFFIDEYCDTESTHMQSASSSYSCNINLSVEDAFLYAPLRLTNRTKILWKAQRWVSDSSLLPVWCRILLHYVDWTSHIPEVQQLDSNDRLLILFSRVIGSISLNLIHRTLKYADRKCLLTTGGTYWPLEEQQLSDHQEDDFMTLLNFKLYESYNSVVELLRNFKLTDEEFILFRLITFFIPCPKLSTHGREVIRNARHRYLTLLADYLKSKYEAPMALERLEKLLCLLPLIEQNVTMIMNHMSLVTLCNIAEMHGSLTHTIYIERKIQK